MTTKKIADLSPDETCLHPEHRPPMHMVYSDGVWEHTCPGCGHVETFTVRNPRYGSTVSLTRVGGVRWQ